MDYNAQFFGATKANHFWFRSRTDFWEWLLKKGLHNKTLAQQLKILYLGSGIGDDLEMFKPYGDVYALDLDQKTLDMIPNHLVKEKVCADACAIPYKNNFFDAVVAFDILEHIPDHNKAAAEVKRVLKEDGTLIFTVPAFEQLTSSHDRMTGHVRRYNKPIIRLLLKDFKQDTLGYWFFSLFGLAALQRFITKNSTNNDYYQQKLPKFIHSSLYRIMTFENWLIKKGLSFPWGLTIYGIYHNKSS
jgi:SAM-dependent methyltransferase